MKWHGETASLGTRKWAERKKKEKKKDAVISRKEPVVYNGNLFYCLPWPLEMEAKLKKKRTKIKKEPGGRRRGEALR